MTSRRARKLVWRKIEPRQGLHKSTIFVCVHGFHAISYFEHAFRILRDPSVTEHKIGRLHAEVS